MTNYTKTTNFATKDALPSGNANKIVKGTEIDTEFNNIATAVATKADTAGPTFTGTVTIPTVDLNGGAIDGTTVGASTAAAITGTTIVANTSINIAGDGATVTGIKDEDDMSSNSATKLATQQSIKAYVDSQITAQDLDFQADSGGALSIDLDSETLTFTGGTGVDTSGSGNAVTFAIDSTVATLTGTQTLTNKTLTSPTLNTPTIGTSFTIGSATITEAELEILDGATVTTAELNVLDGITSTTAELNILDGVTSTAAELNILDGVTATAAELNILDGVTSTAAELNILDGVTSTTAELNILDGVTSTTAELNILDGVTSTTAELNILDGVTATTAELNYVDGVTSAIQTQIDAKAPLASPTFTGTVTANDSSSANSTTLTLINSRTTDASGDSSQMMFQHYRSYSPAVTDSAYIKATKTQAWDATADRTSKLEFGTRNGASEPATRMTIMPDGSVGIGTSSPATALDVTGTVTADGAVIQSDGATVTVSSADYEVALLGRRGSSGVDLDKGFLRLKDTNTTKVAIDSAGSSYFNGGNVGIGTTSPSAKLEISGVKNTSEIRLSSTTNDASWSSNDYFGKLSFYSDDASAAGAGIKGSIVSAQGGSSGGTPHMSFNVASTSANEIERMRIDASGNVAIFSDSAAASGTKSLQFSRDSVERGRVKFDFSNSSLNLQADGVMTFMTAGENERMRIDASGNVGIGTDSPDEQIHLHGGSSATRLRISGGALAETYGGFIEAEGVSGQGGHLRLGVVDDGTDRVAIEIEEQGNQILFSTAGTERMRIDSSGNVLVGKTSTGFVNSNNWAVEGASVVQGHVSSLGSGSVYTYFIHNTSSIGSISQNGTTAVLYNTSSDERLKDNIVDAPSASDDIDAIQVRSFDWKADGSHQKYGMVAQELQSVAPEAVSAPEDSEEMMGVDYSKLVPMLVKEIQSLRSRVHQLENN